MQACVTYASRLICCEFAWLQVYRGSNKVQEVAGAYKDELERMLVARCSLSDAQ